MGKVRSGLAVLALLAAGPLSPHRSIVLGQSAPSVSCVLQPMSSPIPGHFTGAWHSDGDYHFAAFNTDVELQIIIDGTLDVMVAANGQISGTATGKVNAPITDYGRMDVSSGIGTISGQVTGSINGPNSTLVLNQPVIDMLWGTFDGGGYRVERFITMPDYQLPVNSFDAVSSSGAISEQNFPEQTVIADGLGGSQTQASGVGSATGTWQLTSSEAASYDQLSTQVDSFISSSNVVLNDVSALLTPGMVQSGIVQPLQTLETTIEQSPDVAPVLFNRIGAWEASAVGTLLGQARVAGGTTDLSTLRHAGDLLRSARLLNRDCSIPDGDTTAALVNAERSALDGAMASRSWSAAALLGREMVVLQADAMRRPLQQEVDGDLHSLVQNTTDRASILDVGRIALALGDEGDATLAAQQVDSQAHTFRSEQRFAQGHKHKKKRVKKRARPKPTPTATATPVPTKTPQQILASGISSIHTQRSGGSSPTFSWQPVDGASRYLVVVTANQAPALVWSWSGTTTMVTYGDTAIEGLPGSASDSWPIALQTGYTWSVLALNERGQVVGAAFRSRS